MSGGARVLRTQALRNLYLRFAAKAKVKVFGETEISCKTNKETVNNSRLNQSLDRSVNHWFNQVSFSGLFSDIEKMNGAYTYERRAEEDY